MRHSKLWLLAAVLAAASGCGKSKLETAEVEGTVTLDGKPLANAVVTFTPVVKTKDIEAPASSGKTDDKGHFKLAVISTGEPGAVIGKHQVVATRNYDEAEGEDADVASYDEDELPEHEVFIEVKADQMNDGSFNIDP